MRAVMLNLYHVARYQRVMPMIHLIESHATEEQVSEMLETLETYIKLAVDIDRGVLAGGGGLHADCEALLLENGSAQESIWGADWVPRTKKVHFEALINLRPQQGNTSMAIQDEAIRARVEEIARNLLEGT
jgi:hypothetical protein